jgi:aryl-phospho-beta-D-glucosidase BglC (GH1 family)
MRGVNFGGWFSQIDAIEEKDPSGFPGKLEHMRSFLGPEDFARVKSWGFDHIRLPLDWHSAFDKEMRPNEEVLLLYDAAVEGIRAAGLEVIVDLHKCPGHDFYDGTMRDQAFFSDPALRRDCLRVWDILAERYGDRPGVMLELLNEPVAPSAAVWNEVKDELAASIRRMAPKSTLVIGSNLWNSAAQFADLTPVDDGNLLYSLHVYNPLIFTHQKAPWCLGAAFLEDRSYPGTYAIVDDGAPNLPLGDAGFWDRGRLERFLGPVFAFRERYSARVACNEFGVYMGGPDRVSRNAWMRDILGLFNEHDVGWSYWNYKNLDFGIVSVGERLFEKAPNYDDPERVDRELLGILQAH